MSTQRFGDPNVVLDRLRQAYQLESDADLARFLEINASTVATWRRKASMKFDRIFEYASELNMNWLLYGEGPVWRAGLERGNIVSEPPGLPDQGEKDIPYYRTLQTTPHGKIINSPESERVVCLELPSSFVNKELEANLADLFLTRFRGDSMTPTIEDRDFILVQKNKSMPFAGRIYLFLLDGSLLCKRIHEQPDNRILIMSDNPRYENLEIDRDHESFKVIGRVLWSGRQL